jgi:phage-related protein
MQAKRSIDIHVTMVALPTTYAWERENRMQGEEWVVEFYLDERDRSPVREFIESLDQKTQSRLAALIEYVRMHNIQAREPHVKNVSGKLYEMRERSDKRDYRIFYFTVRDRRIVLLHGFQKKSQRTPKREIEVAQERLALFQERDANWRWGEHRMEEKKGAGAGPQGQRDFEEWKSQLLNKPENRAIYEQRLAELEEEHAEADQKMLRKISRTAKGVAGRTWGSMRTRFLHAKER